jgi:IclR family KDG regulon transcriptional repressor
MFWKPHAPRIWAMKPATSIEKISKIFAAFRYTPVLGIKEISERTALIPSDVHRLLRSLEVFGYVDQDVATKKYRLGLELLKLGHIVHQRIEIRKVARPFVQRLATSTEANVNLAVFDPHQLEIVFVDQADASNEFEIRLRVGAPASPHATSVGKILVAHLDPAISAKLLKKNGMKRYTRNTTVELEQLQNEFRQIRKQGYGTDREEVVEGAFCVGAPIRDHTGTVIAAVSISIKAHNASESNEASLISAVKKTANQISIALGYESVLVGPGGPCAGKK